jgi:hypothetical protein
MIVGIDSADKKTITGIVSGAERDIFQLYSEIEQLMKSEGINPPFHWTSIKSSRRESIIKEFEKKINFSRINFTVLIHRDKSNIPSLELFHETVPKVIADSLSKWIGAINGKILFEVNGDFDIRKTKTTHFVHKLFSYLASFLSKELVKIRYKNGVYITEFKQKNGGLIMLVGYVAGAKASKVIQIADLLLGCFRYKARFNFERIFIKKIC